MWSHNMMSPARRFSTPPPTWKSNASFPLAAPASEKKQSMANKNDHFHVINKVPAGDSPYVRAKQVQLIERDPNRAISLFWAAINSGDRVDSALKDMAVVMKQLNRSDEAIEAIKSFRHLCPQEAQESLDNVLVELYKRSGRLDEQIEMLHHKLKYINQGLAFGGKRTKMGRSQGKKIQITIDQEKSRLLGNLAWAYLQQGNYKAAEELYKQALALEEDKNKECNLAICLMHMNKIKEAKAILYAVWVSSRNRRMDESYAKSFERAYQMLSELEEKSVIDPNEQEGHEEMKRQLRSPVSKNSKGVNSCINEGKNCVFDLVASRRKASREQETVLLDKPNRRSYFQNQFENKDNFSRPDDENSKCKSLGLSGARSPHNLYDDKWKREAQLENPIERSDFADRKKGNHLSSAEKVRSAHRKTYCSPLPVRGNSKFPSTEQRRGSCLLSKVVQRKNIREENTADSPSSKPSFEEAQATAPQNLNGHLQASRNENFKISLPTSEKCLPSPGGSCGGIAKMQSEVVMEPIPHSSLNRCWKWNSWGSDEHSQLKNDAIIESRSQPVANGNKERDYWGNAELQKFQMKGSNLSPNMQLKSPIARVAIPITLNDGQYVVDGDKQRNYWENVDREKFPMQESNMMSPSMQLKSPASVTRAEAPASFNNGQPIADGDSKRYYWENGKKNKFSMSGSKSSPSMQLKSPTPLDEAIAPATFTDGECWEQSFDIQAMRDVRLAYSFDKKCFRKNSGKVMSLQQVAGNPEVPNQDFSKSKKKSWADMVEEEEQELVSGRPNFLESRLDYCYQKPSFSFQTPNKWYDGWSHGEDFNDENFNSNLFHQTPPSLHEMDDASYKLEALDLKDGYNDPGSDVSSRNNPIARRSLCFDQQQQPELARHGYPSPLPNKALNFEGHKFVPANESMSTSGSTIKPKRRNRLQVFQDITLHTESPTNMA